MGLKEGILSCQLSNHPDKHYNATHCYSPKGRCYRRLDHRHGQGGKWINFDGSISLSGSIEQSGAKTGIFQICSQKKLTNAIIN